jgi:translation initiation factor eIF-2B subunit delta
MDDRAFDDAVAALRADRAHGAAELARRALAILRDSAADIHVESAEEFRLRMAARLRALISARPSMVAIQNLILEWADCLIPEPGVGHGAVRAASAERAANLIAASREASGHAADRAARLIGSGKTVLTHSRSSTVLLTCDRLKDAELRMIVTESRPLNEGHTVAAQLSDWDVPATLITEAQIGLAMADADLALVGADTVCADGSVVNKAGTSLVALAARQQGRPFYVCCEGFKMAALSAPTPVLEEMDPAELAAPGWSGVTVRNTYFDITPPSLVTAWITEDGVSTEFLLKSHQG